MRLRTLIVVITLAVVTAGVAAAPRGQGPPASMLSSSCATPKSASGALVSAPAHRRRPRWRPPAPRGDSVVAENATLGTAVGTIVLPPTMDQSLAATLMADGVVTRDEVAAQQKRATRAKKLARHWKVKVRRLKEKLHTLRQVAEWNGNGQWKPLIETAAAKYGVSAAGLHRMMMLESGGQRTVGGMYKGLFQYYPSTWRRQWEPLAAREHLQRLAQIRATAYAVPAEAWVPSQWPNTYPMAF